MISVTIRSIIWISSIWFLTSNLRLLILIHMRFWIHHERIINSTILFPLSVFIGIINFMDYKFVSCYLKFVVSHSWFIIWPIYSSYFLSESVNIFNQGRSLFALNSFDLFHGTFSICKLLLLLDVSLSYSMCRGLSV